MTRKQAADVGQIGLRLTLFLAWVGVEKPPSGFSYLTAKRLEQRSWNFLTLLAHSLRILCHFLGQVGSGHQSRSRDTTFIEVWNRAKKPEFSFQQVKLSGCYDKNSIQILYILYFSYRWLVNFPRINQGNIQIFTFPWTRKRAVPFLQGLVFDFTNQSSASLDKWPSKGHLTDRAQVKSALLQTSRANASLHTM